MKKLYFIIMVFSFLLLVNSQIVKAEDTPADTKGAVDVSNLQDAGNKICPVMGEKIDEKTKATYEYKGKIYNFCCPMCIESFKKNPESYIKNIEKEKELQENTHKGHHHN